MILDIIKVIQSNINEGAFSSGFFYWLDKSFWCSGSQSTNMRFYAFQGIINDCFGSHLWKITQVTIVGQMMSNKLNIMCGIPQGPVLGLFLFLLYANDLCSHSNKLNFFLSSQTILTFSLIRKKISYHEC